MSNLSLIDWRLVAFSAVWILGLAIVLSVLSMAYYQAQITSHSLRHRLGQAGPQLAMDGGLALFCVGMAGTSGSWWERGLWGVLAAVFLAFMWGAWRRLE